MMFLQRRITVFAGHYGSGKTNLSVNYALQLSRAGNKVMVLDLDIVNPYFRTKDSLELFAREGIRLITSDYANTNVEAPSIAPDSYAAFDSHDSHVVIDVGGDDAGAVALGRFQDRFSPEELQMILVYNPYRLQTQTVADTLPLIQSIEQASRMSFHGMVNNPNLGYETTAQTVVDSLPLAQELSRALGLPLYATAAKEALAPDLLHRVGNLWQISIYGRNQWSIYDNLS